MYSKLLLLLLINVTTLASISAQTAVSGYVYVDKNANNVKDKREKGLANVSVSNGQEVVVTDSKGHYVLPIGEDNIVFVIKPSGYQVPLNENSLPQYYYNHKPGGSPELKYAGVSATGHLPQSVDFPLTRQREKRKFSAYVFGDPQARSVQEVGFFERGIVDEVSERNKAMFGISLGDLAFDRLEVFEPYIQAIGKMGTPWHNVLGNHDMNYDVAADSLSDETFERHFGPANYSANYGNVHLIVLDNVIYPSPKKGEKYTAGLREDQFDFIKNNLKFVPKDRLVVIASHIPLGGKPYTQRLFNLLAEFPNTLSLSAHTHRQYQKFFTKADGWGQEAAHHHYNVGTTSGNWYSGELNENGIPVSTMADGTPKGYAIINFDKNKYTIDYKVAGESPDYRMNIRMPEVLGQGGAADELYVNFFMGYKDNEVVYRVDGGDWKPMTFTNDFDPEYLHLRNKWEDKTTKLSGKRPGNPSKSTHLWKASLASDLPAGEHKVEVRATDIFGRSFTQEKSFRVATKN